MDQNYKQVLNNLSKYEEKFKFIEDIERGYDPIFDDVNEYELAEKRAMQEEIENLKGAINHGSKL